MKAEDLFHKIVTEKRGGYCFELQGLYEELLRSCGFHVVQYAARFMDGYSAKKNGESNFTLVNGRFKEYRNQKYS